MSNKTVTVVPAAGTGDYHTLQDALTGEASNLTTDCGGTGSAGILTISIENGGSSWASADTARASITGYTTSAAYYINIVTDANNRALKTGWSTSRYRLQNTVDSTYVITLAEDFVRIDGLQIRAVESYQVIISSGTIGATSDIRFSNCRLDNAGVVAGGIACYDSSATVTVWNTIFHNNGLNRPAINFDSGTIYLYNCIIHAISGDAIWNADSGVITVKNCAIFNNTDDFEGTMTIDYCASDDGGGTNEIAESGGGADWTSDFNAAATGDFTLLTGSNLKYAGTVPAASIYTTDMEGETYNDGAYSLGVDEIIAAGGSLIPLMMNHYRRLRI